MIFHISNLPHNVALQVLSLLHLHTQLANTILDGEEPAQGTSESKVPTFIKALGIKHLREIERPCGTRKDPITFKLLCGWKLMITCLLFTVGASGVLEFLSCTSDVIEIMKAHFMFYKTYPKNPKFGLG